MRAPPLRLMIVLSWAALVAAQIVRELQAFSLTPEVRVAIDQAFIANWMELNESAPVAFKATLAIFFGLLLANLVGAIAMFFFCRWGRSLSLWTTAAMFIGGAALFMGGLSTGPQIYTGVEGWLLHLSGLCWGAALALAYWSSAAQRFDAPRNAANRVDITLLAPP
jgi:hypothetical protein